MARLGAGVSLLLYASLLVGQQQQLNRTFRSMTPGSLSMPMVAPLFLEDSDFSSTVTLANDAIAKMRARVVVLDSQGSQAAFKELEMPGIPVWRFRLTTCWPRRDLPSLPARCSSSPNRWRACP